ncbi:leucine-rich repeat protein [Eubacterium sp.]|uniref:leucine-rich repeat protein n=1 Tax=Eubacterium sp. TaxID=142586 RepID=UPI0025ED6585|nr:leucine-rich repeat protein [Eubacterium sp.]MCR5628122.1 leucine-rich repeat domain-containing protein [Eubacterium sp.]
MNLIKEMKKILCCFIVMCAAFAVSGIFGVTSTYADRAYDEQLVIGENKEFTSHSEYYVFKFLPDKTGVYNFEAPTEKGFYITVYNSDNDKMGERGNGCSFYALEGNTYYIRFRYITVYSSSYYEAGYSVKYTFSLEKEMECIPCFDCRVKCGDKDLLAEGDNFKFDSKTLTLEIRDYKGEAPEIDIIDVNNIGIIYDLKDVHSDNVYFNIKITGNNTLVINDFYWDLDVFGERPLAIRFVGNGVLNLKNESNSRMYYGLEVNRRDMVIDGPIINISCNVSLDDDVKSNYEAVYIDGNFEMISGEFNIDSKYNGLRVGGNAFFKGGKININVSESDNTPAICFDGVGEGNFEGTDINIDVKGIEKDIFNPISIVDIFSIKYTGGTLSVKADEYVDVIHTYEFNMTGGSINADLSSSGFIYGSVISGCKFNVDGGDFIIKYNETDLPDEVSGLKLGGNLGSSRYGKFNCNIDNIQVVLVAGDEKMQQIIEQSDIDSLEKLFEFDENDTFNFGKNINIIIGKDIDINKLGIKLLEESFIYDGTEKKPKLNLRGLREGIDVEVTYSDNVNAGEGKVIVKGKGDYTGTVTFKFSIKAKDENVAKKDNNDNNTKNNTETSIFDDGKLIYKIVKPAGKKYGKVSVIGLKKKSLKKINIKASVKHAGLTYKIASIGANAFKNNKKIISVKIGKNVTKIGKKAFYNCKKIKKVIIKSVELKKVGKKAYAKTSKKLVIKVASKKKKAYSKKLKNAGFKGKIK